MNFVSLVAVFFAGKKYDIYFGKLFMCLVRFLKFADISLIYFHEDGNIFSH